MALTVIRLILAVFGIVLFVGGLILLAAGGAAAVFGFWALLSGGVLLIAIVLERSRYRSGAAERTSEPSGPGGGEPGPLEPRFEGTAERFIDPTSDRVMQVFIDPQTGERRYQAEP